MVQLRLAPSGPLIQGQNDGDLLVWNNTTREWDITTITPGGETAWDFIIEDVADFPNPPAAGFIDLVDGSYAIKAGVDLGTDALRIPGGVNVLIKGMGDFNQKFVDSDHATGTLIVDTGGSCRLETLNLRNNGGGNALHIDGGGGGASAVSRNCQFDGDASGVFVTGLASFTDVLSRIGGSSAAPLHVLGDGANGVNINLVNTRVTAGGVEAARFEGAGLEEVNCTQCRFSSSNGAAVIIDTSTGDLQFIDCEAVSLIADSPGCYHVLEASTLQIIGGQWRTLAAARGNGLNIDGDVPGGLQVLGVAGEDISTSDPSGEAFIKYTSGTVNRATVMGCNTSNTVSTAINWPAASIPTAGLVVVGNTWNDPTPYVGFVSTDARVNVKANLSSAGLMTETAIVP